LRDRRRYSGGREGGFFFGAAAPRLTRPELVVQVPHINHPEVVTLADRLKPDVIAVFGTSLIRGPLLERGRLGMFNLHGGLSPQYRGADCTFWALYNGEPERVGCTLHRIDSGIDTGPVIAHICPEVHEGDGELTLFWRAVRESAEVYAELLERLERGEQLGRRQSDKGNLYQVKQRGWREERRLAAQLGDGLRGLHLPRRITWFQAA
jgi:methionyl-tRNA formyltransferase